MATLKQFRYFTALAETRHFGAAAQKCAITQPALSVQIKALERELGLVLVERRVSGAVLTVEGEEVAARARAILAAERDVHDYALHRTKLATGPLRLGAIPSIAPYLMPRVLQAIAGRYPELELSLRETITETLVEALVTGDLDTIVIALPAEHPDIETAPLFYDGFLLAEPASRPLRTRLPTFESIAGDRLLLLEEGHCLRDQALSLCRTEAGDGGVGFSASSLATILQMVAGGFGVTLLPEMAAARELPKQAPGQEMVRLMRFAAPEPGRMIGLAWRARSPRREDFLSLCALFPDLAEEGFSGLKNLITPIKT